IFGARFHFGGAFRVKPKIDQFATMRRNEMAVRFCSVDIYHEERFYTIGSGFPQREVERRAARLPTLKGHVGTNLSSLDAQFFTLRSGHGRNTRDGLRFEDRR